MTFYWWSHWFWITLLGCVLVSAYPSQELTSELNRSSKERLAKQVTKLYQTTAAVSWSTSVSPYLVEKTILKSISPEKDLDDLLDDADDDIDMDDALDAANLDADFNEDVEKDVKEEDNLEEDGDDLKRSAEIVTSIQDNSDLELNSPKAGSQNVLKLDDAEKISNSVNKSKDELIQPTILNINKTIDQKIQENLNNTNNDILKDEVKPNTATPSTPRIMNSNLSATIQADVSLATNVSNNSSNHVEEIHKVPFTLENVNREDEIRRAENEHRTRKPKVLSADYKNLNRVINYSSQTKSILTRSASTEANQYENNIASEALSVQRTYFLDASAISAICFTVFGVCCTIGTIGIVLYRRRFLNKPQTLSEPDSSVYIDDSTLRVSDNSDEMYSLDNDSFLNSLEAMTIQNYWTDTVKHTKL